MLPREADSDMTISQVIFLWLRLVYDFSSLGEDKS